MKRSPQTHFTLRFFALVMLAALNSSCGGDSERSNGAAGSAGSIASGGGGGGGVGNGGAGGGGAGIGGSTECEKAGGKCVATMPGSCQGGVIAVDKSCGSTPSVGAECCMPGAPGGAGGTGGGISCGGSSGGLGTPGALDGSFGQAGVVDLMPGNATGVLMAIAVQPDDKILVAGGPNDAIYLARFNADGSADMTFGVSGVVTLDPMLTSAPGYAISSSRANAIAIQPDGKIVIAGEAHLSGPDGMYVSQPVAVIARFEPDGSLDKSFGAGGYVAGDFFSAHPDHVVIEPDGKIVVADYAGPFRFNSDGSLDKSFGVDGIANMPPSPGSFLYIAALAPNPAGGVILAGNSTSYGVPAPNGDFAVSRLDSSGAADPSFGSSGLTLTDFFGQDDSAIAATILAGGAMLVAGSAQHANSVLGLVRYQPTGTLDPAFGTAGKVTVDVSPGTDTTPFAMATQTNGQIVVGANAYTVALTRLSADGALDPSFGPAGTVLVDPCGVLIWGIDLGVQSTNRIVVLGLSIQGYRIAGFKP